MMKTALVTGGAGFIGSHLVKRLIAEGGWRVFVVDNLSTGFRSNLPPKIDFIELDISKADFVDQLPKERFDDVFHLAAQSSGEISFEDPAYDLQTNALATLLLLKWCKDKGSRRFLYTSSMSVYGDQETQPVAETARLYPKSFYGVGKVASEHYCDIFAKQDMHITTLRLFNVYGPGQNMLNLKQGMVSIYMAYIAKGVPIVVKGSIDRFRDFVYIDDVIEAYMKCLESGAAYGRCFNVGSGIRTKVAELIDEELRVFGHNPTSYPIVQETQTPGDAFGIFSDISLIKSTIGWQPQVVLADGLKRMADWVRSLSALEPISRS